MNVVIVVRRHHSHDGPAQPGPGAPPHDSSVVGKKYCWRPLSNKPVLSIATTAKILPLGCGDVADGGLPGVSVVRGGSVGSKRQADRAKDGRPQQ